jgi:hypothetical protein
MGRTGRKRKGRVVLLLTKGREEEAYNRAQYQYKSVQNAIATQQGNKIIMFAPSYDVIPANYPRPECQKLVMNIDETPTNHVRKEKRNSSEQTQDIYLNADESLEYQLQFKVPRENSCELELGRYAYRNVLPLPCVYLERSDRSLEFNTLMVELEGLVATEEESTRNQKCRIQNIGQYESSSPLCIDIGRTLQYRSKVVLPECDFLSPLPLRCMDHSVNMDNTIENDSDFIRNDIEEENILDKVRSRRISISSDSTLSPLPLKQIATPVDIDSDHDIDSNKGNYSKNDNDGNCIMIHDAQSPIFDHHGDQDLLLNQMLDIDPNEWMISYEELKSLSPKVSNHKLKDTDLKDLDPEQLENLENDCEAPCPQSSQTPIIKAKKKKMIICDASSSAKGDVFVKPAPTISKSNQKRSMEPSIKNTKKKKLDYSNPYFDLEACLSEKSSYSADEEDVDFDGNLSGLIAESPLVKSQEINYYRKSLLSPDLGGLGTKKTKVFRFNTPKRFEPCTQLMPDSDTPGSLANFVVDDESMELSHQLDSLPLDDFLETYSSDHE